MVNPSSVTPSSGCSYTIWVRFMHTHSSLLEAKQRLGQGRHQESDLASKYVINNIDLASMLV